MVTSVPTADARRRWGALIALRGAATVMMVLIGWGQFAFLGWFTAELARSVSLRLAGGLFLGAVLLRRAGLSRDAGAAVLFGVVGMYPWILDANRPRASMARSTSGALKVVAANASPLNGQIAALVDDLQRQRGHLIVLPEPPAALVDGLAEVGFEPVVDAADSSKFGLAIVARADPRLKVRTATVVRMGPTGSAIGIVRFEWARRPAILYGVHPPAPTSARQMRSREMQIEWLSGQARTSTVGVVVAGDFNTTFASPSWRRLTERVRRPEGWSPATWPVALGPLGLSIDHVLVSEHWTAGPEQTFHLTDSDHRGVTAALMWR